MAAKPSVIVTGGCGFIGGHLIDHLHDLGYSVTNIDNQSIPTMYIPDVEKYYNTDLKESVAVKEIVSECKPSIIFHLAAQSHVDTSITGPQDTIHNNITSTVNLLEAVRSTSVDRFILVSTDEVYGSVIVGEFDEFSRYEPNSPYASSKVSCDLIARSYRQTYGLPIVVTNCSNNFGPRQALDKFIPKVIHNALKRMEIPIYGDGTNQRDWLYVKDHVIALVQLSSRVLSNNSYNIGTSKTRNNYSLALFIAAIVDDLLDLPCGTSAALIRFVPDRLGHDFRYAVNSDRIKKDIGWTPTSNFNECLHDTVAWYWMQIKDGAL